MALRSATSRRGVVFVDAAAWIALLNQADELHSRAHDLRRQLQRDGRRLLTTQFVLLEVAYALSSPRHRSGIPQFFETLANSEAVTVLPVSSELFSSGLALYADRPDKAWSLTDCISFVATEEEGLTDAFTCDKHFEQAGFTRLMVM